MSGKQALWESAGFRGDTRFPSLETPMRSKENINSLELSIDFKCQFLVGCGAPKRGREREGETSKLLATVSSLIP